MTVQTDSRTALKSELVTLAAYIGPSVSRELEKSRTLLEAGHSTEAALRLGRAVEAILYAIANEFGIELKNREIKILADLQQSIRTAEVALIRDPSIEKVLALAKISQRLSEAIARLAEDDQSRKGEP